MHFTVAYIVVSKRLKLDINYFTVIYINYIYFKLDLHPVTSFSSELSPSELDTVNAVTADKCSDCLVMVHTLLWTEEPWEISVYLRNTEDT